MIKTKKTLKKEILAKDNGISLTKHSYSVANVAVWIAKKIMPDLSHKIIEAIKLSSLSHDTGKCTSIFQKKLSKIKDIGNLEYKLPFRHNEVGWAFLSRHLNIKDKELLNMILNCVYWHHGVSNEMNKYNDTDIKINAEDTETMIEYCKTIFDESIVYEKPYRPQKSPKYYIEGEYERKINPLNMFIRACVVSADQIVSSLEYKENDEKILDSIFEIDKKNFNIDIKKHIYYGNDRFKQQCEIIENLGRTTIVKAPAGFGKTLVGLLCMIKKGKKIIWVCPRNEVAYSVYDSISKELKNFGVDNVSVELFLTGEVKESKNFSGKDFSSDIIITNIDNYLKPSVDSKNGDRLYTILSSLVVFDEYHELIGDAALFACFINLMRLRHQYTKSETLLLTATPLSMEFLWENELPGTEKTVVLPNKESHYPAQHQKKYKINILKDFIIKNKDENNLVIFNAISNAQTQLRRFGEDSVLVHSRFNEKDKKERLDYVYSNYGKHSDKSFGKPIVVGTPIIQASLDVSFCHVYESVLSPEATGQRFGRNDRFGDYNAQSSFNIVNLDNNAENAVRDILYTKELSKLWFDCISKYDKQEITSDVFYAIYNKFSQDNKKILEEYVIDKYFKSLNQLSLYVHPTKHFEGKQKNDKEVIYVGGNKLRTLESGFFTICKIYGSTNFTEPINLPCYDIKDFYQDVANNKNSILKTMKRLRNENDERFDYNDMIKKEKINFDVYGKRSDMPHIDFDKVYHPDYGIIEESKLINLLKF